MVRRRSRYNTFDSEDTREVWQELLILSFRA